MYPAIDERSKLCPFLSLIRFGQTFLQHSFFTHLIDTLGPDVYLAPVEMLLVEKSTNRVVRQEKDEAQQTLALPLAALARQSHEKRFTVSTVCQTLLHDGS